MSVKKYNELKDLARKQHFEGIEYVFGDKQLKEYQKRHGYTEESFREALKSRKLCSDGFGGLGTPEAFKVRSEYYAALDAKIKNECTGDDVFESEWWNHECGLSYDIGTPLAITQNIFPEYKPSRKLLNRLQKEFDKLN